MFLVHASIFKIVIVVHFFGVKNIIYFVEQKERKIEKKKMKKKTYKNELWYELNLEHTHTYTCFT